MCQSGVSALKKVSGATLDRTGSTYSPVYDTTVFRRICLSNTKNKQISYVNISERSTSTPFLQLHIRRVSQKVRFPIYLRE
jgi:hypothetical protein